MHPELKNLLDAVSSNLEEKTALLVTADWCQENGDETALEGLLRYMANSLSSRYFCVPLFTGSRRYGAPRPDSDWDWVLLCDYLRQRNLAALVGKKYSNDILGECGVDLCLRFGPVNLLLVSSWDQYNAWDVGTWRLADEKPVTRERAVAVFSEEFRRKGLINNNVSGDDDLTEVPAILQDYDY